MDYSTCSPGPSPPKRQGLVGPEHLQWNVQTSCWKLNKKDFRAVQNKHHTCQRNTWYKTFKKTQSNKNMCDLYCVSENLRAVVQLRNYNKCLHVCLCVLQGFKHTSKKKRQVSLPDAWCKNMHLKVKTAKGMQRIHPLLKTRHRYLIVL